MYITFGFVIAAIVFTIPHLYKRRQRYNALPPHEKLWHDCVHLHPDSPSGKIAYKKLDDYIIEEIAKAENIGDLRANFVRNVGYVHSGLFSRKFYKREDSPEVAAAFTAKYSEFMRNVEADEIEMIINRND